MKKVLCGSNVLVHKTERSTVKTSENSNYPLKGPAEAAAAVEKLRSSDTDMLEMPLSYENCRVNVGCCRTPGRGSGTAICTGRCAAALWFGFEKAGGGLISDGRSAIADEH